METNIGEFTAPRPQKSSSNAIVRWVGVILLLFVAYVHFALFLNMMSFRMLPVLFLIDTIGALVAMVGVLKNASWLGWALGIVMAGGSAVAKIAMNTVPGFGAFLMGFHRGGHRPKPPQGSANGHFAHSGFHPPHGVLPLFFHMRTLGNVAVALELIFVVLAIFALVAAKRNSV